MKISELCYALQKLSETEGDLEVVDFDLREVEYPETFDKSDEKVVRLC